MFKENKFGPGRPAHQQQMQQHMSNGSQRPSQYTGEYPDGLPQNYTYHPNYVNTSLILPQMNQTQQSGFPQPRNQFFPQQSNVRFSAPNGVTHKDSNEIQEQDEDERSWCFCGEKSYGEMVSCDNKCCTYQWFHFPCVGITETPTGRWFCPECIRSNNPGQ